MQKNVQWYPGHMFKAKKEIMTQLKNIDLVVEILDARVPMASHNEMLDELTNKKKKLLVFSKKDLVDVNILKKAQDIYITSGYDVCSANLKNGKDRAYVLKEIEKSSKEIKEKFLKKGINKKIRILVMGMPNVGKSTFINFLSEKKKTQVGNRPGVTKQQQWIMVGSEIELLDTPGILVPKINNIEDGLNLVACSLIKDEVVNLDDVAVHLIIHLFNHHLENLNKRYKINITQLDLEIIYDKIGMSIGALLKNREIDYERVSKTIINDFRSQNFGKIMLDEIR